MFFFKYIKLEYFYFSVFDFEVKGTEVFKYILSSLARNVVWDEGEITKF